MSQKTVDILRECIPTFTVLSDENLHLSRPAVSHHLKIMLDAGLVRVDQQGKERYYTVSLQQAGERFQRLMASFIEDGCIQP